MLIKFTLFLTNENTLENFNTNQPRDDLHANIVQGFGLKFSIPSNYALLLIIHYYYDPHFLKFYMDNSYITFF